MFERIRKIKIVRTKKICLLLQKIEAAFNIFRLPGKLYDKVFYNKLLEAELSLTDLEPGSKILHIGTGPRPMTAIFLAERGFYVDGVEIEDQARLKSQELIKDQGLNSRINIFSGNGYKVDYSKYEAIWISLHVEPKRYILNKILNEANIGAKIIYRNPASWLTKFYQPVCPQKLSGGNCKTTGIIKSKKSCLVEV